MLRLRGIVAALAAAGLAVLGSACGAASEGASAFSNGDAGTAYDGTSAEDSGSATGRSSDWTAAGASTAQASTEASATRGCPTGALFVHASGDAPDLRLCWKVGAGGFSNVDVPFPSGAPAPASNYPALPVGETRRSPMRCCVGGDVTIVGIPANLLYELDNAQKPAKCADLLSNANAGQGIAKGLLLYPFTIPGGIIAGSTSVIALAGCSKNANNPTAPVCGAGASASGNLHADVLPLYPVSQSDGGQLPVQVGKRSRPGAARGRWRRGGRLVRRAGRDFACRHAHGGRRIRALRRCGPERRYEPDSYGTLGFGVDVVGTDAGPGHLWMSLEQSLELVDPMMNPTVYYSQQDTYVVVVVGDPGSPHAFAPDASFDGTGLHIMVLPL